jgi:hypothetical protein
VQAVQRHAKGAEATAGSKAAERCSSSQSVASAASKKLQPAGSVLQLELQLECHAELWMPGQVASLSLGGGGPGLNGETCATTTDGFRAAICAATNAGGWQAHPA